jgi:hypothetical protein
MKKRKTDGLKLACLLLAAALAASGVGLWLLRQGDARTRGDEVSQRLEQVRTDLSFGGAQAVLQSDMESAVGWLGSENGNLILTDKKGGVTGTLNDNLLDGAKQLRLVISPHFLNWRDSMSEYSYGALALILDGDGQILHRFLMLTGPYNAPEDLAAFNRNDSARASLFPKLNEPLYEAYNEYLGGVDSSDWDEGWEEHDGDATPASGGVEREEWMGSDEALNALEDGATQADVDAVKRYCQWERDQLKQAGDWCAQLVKAENGLYALALYENNGDTNTTYNSMISRWQVVHDLFPFWALGLAALILLMAFWVLRDARKRDFKPALWGILVLLGNAVALIVYLIVRPADCRCPACGVSVRRGYLVCPMCAAPLRVRCPGCGKPQEDAWVCCPYCGWKKESP